MPLAFRWGNQVVFTIPRGSYYRNFVFGWRGPPGQGQRLVVKGGFIEDKLSQVQLAEIRTTLFRPCFCSTFPIPIFPRNDCYGVYV
eukprot:COSAG05_NODE_626_length_8254_cov_12.820846_4_plen_86_part_00